MTSLLLLLPQSSSFFFFFISSSLSLLSVQVSLPSIQQQQQGSVICHKCTSPYVTTVYHWWYYNKLQLNRISKLDDVNDWKCLKMAFWDWKCRIWDLIVLICFFVVCLRLYGNTILSWLNEETVFLVYVYWCAYLMFCRMKDKNSHAHAQAHSLITLSLSLSQWLRISNLNHHSRMRGASWKEVSPYHTPHEVFSSLCKSLKKQDVPMELVRSLLSYSYLI